MSQSKRKERIRRREEDFERGANLIGGLSRRDLLLLGFGLYWGEGYKSLVNNEFGFTNSDPEMIVVYVRWLREVFNISSQDLILRVSINRIHQNREREVVSYWKELLGVSENQFTKTSFIKTLLKKKYKNNDNYFGVLRIKVKRGGRLKHEVLGALKKISQVLGKK